jgi:hypothetical protein
MNSEEYSRTKDKELIDKEVKKFLKKGGKIEVVRSRMGGDEYHQREPGSSVKVKRFGK